MMANKIILCIILSVGICSCSRKLTQENLAKPFKTDFEKYINQSYKEFDSYPLTYTEYYSQEKGELDRAQNILKEVIDSLGLLNKDEWVLINQYGTNYTGPYEKTYIILESTYYQYDLPQPGVGVDINKYEVVEKNIEDLKSYHNQDLFKIYQVIKNKTNTHKLNSQPKVNPLIIYSIIHAKDKKMKTFKITSQDYKIRNW